MFLVLPFDHNNTIGVPGAIFCQAALHILYALDQSNVQSLPILDSCFYALHLFGEFQHFRPWTSTR